MFDVIGKFIEDIIKHLCRNRSFL